MRTIIAGSRTVTDAEVVEEAILRSNFKITTVVSGTARGVDRLGERWAIENEVPILFFPPDWHVHGKKAGYVRNAEMARNADALIAVWDGRSSGTKMMIDIARENDLMVHVAQVETV